MAHTLEVNDDERLVVNTRELDCTTLVETVTALTLCVYNKEYTFDAYCRHHIVQTVKGQRREAHLLADLIQHLVISVGIRIAVVFQDRTVHFTALFLTHHTAGDQFHLGIGTGEVDIFTSEHNGRARRTHMYSLCAALV